MEQYRSGHNEPDSKSGRPKGPVGSNPTCSAKILFINSFDSVSIKKILNFKTKNKYTISLKNNIMLKDKGEEK